MTKPFVKWAGGKTQLLPEIKTALEPLIVTGKSLTYVEPFVGGGAVLFWVVDTFPNIEKVVINDINPDLVDAYKTIVQEPESLAIALSQIEKNYYQLKDFEAKKVFYLEKRQEFNRIKIEAIANESYFTDIARVKKTVLFIFLNKTCFNGLYRVNSKGLFNVPFGGNLKPKICDRDNLLAISDRLRNADILQGDFTQTLSYLSENTVFYIDPPYKPISTTASFTSYTKENFDNSDQIRVKEFCDRIHKAGGKFISSNSDTKNSDRDPHFFENLYRDYTIRRVQAKRSINCKGGKRGAISEILITNFVFNE
ncbi:MAG: DNA adenine methylase [Cyanobacteriota bacterium]|nr:DNA adenine methylase [Cyanobacteriota bacterium]